MNLLEKLGLVTTPTKVTDPTEPAPSKVDPNADATTLVEQLPSGVYDNKFCEDCGGAIYWQYHLVTKGKVFCRHCGQKKYWSKEYCAGGHYTTHEPDPNMLSSYYSHSVYSADGKSHAHGRY